MGSSDIDYEGMANAALRGMVRDVLKRTLDEGLPGEHHFYICFDTRAEGVILSKRLREQYPEEMTIVLQHRFWDLAVDDVRFEVKLTFNGIPERLVVPFAAIRVFFDPSVPYGLQFDGAQMLEDVHRQTTRLAPVTGDARPNRPEPPARLTEFPVPMRKPKGEDTPSLTQPLDQAPEEASGAKPTPVDVSETPADHAPEETEGDGEERTTATVVELDAFRNKK